MVLTIPSSLLVPSNFSHHHLSSNATTHPMIDSSPPAGMIVAGDEIPTIDYLALFSADPNRRSTVMDRLSLACEDYGFFNLVNHGIEDGVMDDVVRGISDFLGETAVEEKSKEALGKYQTKFHEVKLGLARAMSLILGQEESYIENALHLESGFDVAAMNVYPPNLHSKGTIRLPEHTDPGFIVSLVQNMDGGLQILTHQGKWVNVHIPPSAILIQILTNGKYKSHIHRVSGNYKAKRITMVTLHGPSENKFVAPGPEFVDDSHPLAYRGMTYSDGLKANGHYEIEVQSCIAQHRTLLP
ncbi:unnamed protein product [Linum tenue]|uniref:Fe2OG dioxygenase domain-containing protein n=1 Tax=Linum tenue TaxID=586396 RepID=A0AAV0IGK3_9ROSI|nr:unnamed protein product [Linum tenue]